MKNAFWKKLGYISFFLIIVCLVPATAQPGDPGGDPDTPISGIEILIALGGLFGVSRFFKIGNKAK